MKMKFLVLACALFGFIGVANAQDNTYPRDLTVCWTHPSLYVDESDIQDGDLATTRLTVDRHDGTRAVDTLIPVVGLPGARQCTTLSGDIPKPGTYTTFAYAITIDDTSSDQSNASVKKYTGKPKPAENLAGQ